MNYSRQREALKRVLRSTRTHPTADWIYKELLQEYPHTSLGTVYRNLAQLSEAGEILRISTGDSKEHYDGFTDPHDHFVCQECGAILDVTVPLPDSVNSCVHESIGAVVDRRSLIFSGTCGACMEKKNNGV